MTRLFITLIICLTLTVITGGGWAEEHLGAGITEEGKNELFKDYATNNRVEQRFDSQTITAPDEFIIHSTSFDADEVYATLLNEDDYGKYDKLSIGKIDFCKKICFKLKGDDVERCVKTEWLYELLKMMQP